MKLRKRGILQTNTTCWVLKKKTVFQLKKDLQCVFEKIMKNIDEFCLDDLVWNDGWATLIELRQEKFALK